MIASIGPDNGGRQQTWRRLHRRAVVGAAGLMGAVVLPFLAVMAWITWSIVFKRGDWSQVWKFDGLGVPEVLAGIFAATAIGCLLYGLLRWRRK
jgi:hypothetical protein